LRGQQSGNMRVRVGFVLPSDVVLDGVDAHWRD
jgi:hypothetical protein